MLLYANRYWTEAISKNLRPYILKAYEEKFNDLKLDEYVITTMENFPGTTTDITLKNHHTWVFPVYVSDKILQGNIDLFPKWGPHYHEGIYLGNSTFHAGSVALFLNSATGHVSPKLHVLFDDHLYTGTFMIEVTILPN